MRWILSIDIPVHGGTVCSCGWYSISNMMWLLVCSVLCKDQAVSALINEHLLATSPRTNTALLLRIPSSPQTLQITCFSWAGSPRQNSNHELISRAEFLFSTTTLEAYFIHQGGWRFVFLSMVRVDRRNSLMVLSYTECIFLYLPSIDNRC